MEELTQIGVQFAYATDRPVTCRADSGAPRVRTIELEAVANGYRAMGKREAL